MYQKIKLILTCAFVFFIQIFFAQVTITIPAGNPPTNTVSVTNVEHRKPLGTYFGYERTAIIYRHNEIGTYGQITSISVYCDSIHTPGSVPLNLYVRETTDSAFTATSTVANEELGATLVYAGTIPAASFVKNQWVVINFITPFTHASSKPVEFIFETNATGAGNEGVNGKFFSHYTYPSSFYTSQYWNADNTAPTTNGIVSYNRPNMQLSITPIAVCSGMPNAGNTLSTNDTLCLNESFVLSLQGNTSATGLSYQWQKSTDGVTFNNITQADSTTLLQILHDTTWYRCAVTCSGQTAYSNTLCNAIVLI
jgi:type II secretory pathway pseudopilin PulG